MHGLELFHTFHVERSTAQARCSTPRLSALSAGAGATCAAFAVSFPLPAHRAPCGEPARRRTVDGVPVCSAMPAR